MVTANTLWLDSVINDLNRKASDRRARTQGDWDGYSSPFLPIIRTDEAVRDDIRRRERMAEAMYEV
jgi:hypothetical protein